jgi:hypothetical protein
MLGLLGLGSTTALAQDAGEVLAFPAGKAQSQTLQIPDPARPGQAVPQAQLQGAPQGVRAQVLGWTPHRHALRVAIHIPAQLAPGLYATTLQITPAGQSGGSLPLRLAVEALYIGRGQGGIVAESTDGQVLQGISQRFTAGIPEQGAMGVSSIGDDPLDGDLFVYAGGSSYITNLVTPAGTFLPSPIPRGVISSAVPSYLLWDGGDRFLWSREMTFLLSQEGQTLLRLPDHDAGVFAPGAATADPETGDFYLSNGAPQTHRYARILIFSPTGSIVGQFHGALRNVMALAYDPENQEIYELESRDTHSATQIQAFTPSGEPIALPPGAFPGTELLGTPIMQTVLTANPVNGNLYYLTKTRILVYSSEGRLLRTLPVPSHSKNITFVPGYLDVPTQAVSATAAEEPAQLVPFGRAAGSMAAPTRPATPPGCPPGYRCVPNPAEPAPQQPSSQPNLNQAVNHAANTVNNVDNLANSVSDLAQVFQ